jgi:hypothetical protein
MRRVTSQWIGTTRAAALLGCAPRTVHKVVAEAGLTVKKLPGQPVRFLLSEVQRLASEALRPVGPAA